jgi:hypothetical protein
MMLSDSDQSAQQGQHHKTLLELKVPIKYCAGIGGWIPQERHRASFIRRYPATVCRRLEGRLALPCSRPSYLEGEACTGGSQFRWLSLPAAA